MSVAQQEPHESPVIATLTITVRANGRVAVTGPIDQKMLCYGMLGVAHDQIRDFKIEASRIHVPT